MEGVTVVTHPLIQHKLTLLREKDRSTKSFRELCTEIGTLLCYEVTRDLPLTNIEIETPLARMSSPAIAGKKLVFAPIMRSGITFVEGMLELVPAARVAHIGLYRDPTIARKTEVSDWRIADLVTAARQSVSKVSAWLRAQFILAGVMGTFAAIGLGLMGVPYFYVIALIAAVGETIPIVGPVIGGITAVAVAITVSPKLALMVGIYFLVLHQLEANVLVPKIMERSVGVSPVAVLVALLIGGSLMGLAGAILAIPTAALLSVIIEEIAADREARIQRIK
jgi:hypothetical protein